jgi:hypothetical protein
MRLTHKQPNIGIDEGKAGSENYLYKGSIYSY